MALPIPWKSIGRVALGFAQYALAQRYAPQPPAQADPAPPPPAVPPVVAPVAPVLTREQRYRDRVDDIYVEILGRPTDTEGERYEAYLLLEADREDELRKNLRARK